MKLNWSKWGFEFWKSVARHTSTAALAALTICYRENVFDWENFGLAVLVAGLLRSVFTFLEKTPAPEEHK